jgi:Flp pilus assembly protein TadD
VQPHTFQLTASVRAEAARLGLEFMARFLEIETQRHPSNVDALAELGHVYTRQSRNQESLAVDRRLVRLVPENPTVHYNLACSLAILGQKDDALDALERAVAYGYDDAEFMRKDEDLAQVWSEGRFRQLVAQLEAGTR